MCHERVRGTRGDSGPCQEVRHAEERLEEVVAVSDQRPGGEPEERVSTELRAPWAITRRATGCAAHLVGFHQRSEATPLPILP